MKRFLILIFMFLLCFAVACEKEEKPNVDTPIDTPEVVEPAETPTETPEITEPVETPTETPEVIEPVETPTETPKVVEPAETLTETPEVVEPAETPEENIIILPEPDENTKYIEIAFPEDFPEEPYQEPNLVSPEEFEWGEYVPFVSMTGIESVNASWAIEKMAILSNKASTLEDAIKIYSDFNDKYLVEYKPKTDFVIDAGRKVSEYPDIADYLYKSKIVCVNEDLSQMVRRSFVPVEDTGNIYVLDSEKYEYIENGEVIYSDAGEGNSYYFFDAKVIKKGNKIIDRIKFYKDCYLCFDEQHKNAQFYSLSDVKMLYDISLPENCVVCDYNTNGILLEKHGTHEVYYYNFCLEKISLVEAFAFNASLSPDAKYVAYTSADYDSNVFSREKGYYIKNLSNNTTVFYSYPYDYYKWLKINCWAQKQLFN